MHCYVGFLQIRSQVIQLSCYTMVLWRIRQHEAHHFIVRELYMEQSILYQKLSYHIAQIFGRKFWKFLHYSQQKLLVSKTLVNSCLFASFLMHTIDVLHVYCIQVIFTLAYFQEFFTNWMFAFKISQICVFLPKISIQLYHFTNLISRI